MKFYYFKLQTPKSVGSVIGSVDWLREKSKNTKIGYTEENYNTTAYLEMDMDKIEV